MTHCDATTPYSLYHGTRRSEGRSRRMRKDEFALVEVQLGGADAARFKTRRRSFSPTAFTQSARTSHPSSLLLFCTSVDGPRRPALPFRRASHTRFKPGRRQFQPGLPCLRLESFNLIYSLDLALRQRKQCLFHSPRWSWWRPSRVRPSTSWPTPTRGRRDLICHRITPNWPA